MFTLSEEKWNELPLPDYRARFFIEAWRSFLNRATPHFYQARLMNSFACIAEIRSVIEDFLSDQKNINYFRISCQEAIDIIKADDVFEECFPSEKDILLLMLKTTKDISNELTSFSVRLNLLLKAIERKEALYLDALTSRLYLSLTSPLENDRKERHLKDIYEKTGRLLSHLISKGYSQTYLYNRVDIISKKSSYEGRSFSDQLQTLLHRLKRNPEAYDVYQAFYAPRNIFMHQEIAGVSVIKLEKEENNQEISKKYGIDKANGLFHKEIVSTDYISASWEMQRAVETVRDLMVFENKNESIELSRKFLVEISSKDLIHKQFVNLAILQDLLIKRPDLYEINMSEAINLVLENDACEKTAIQALQRSLRYYRLGITESTFDSKFLSMWISLEAIFDFSNESIMDRVLAVLPRIYAFESLIKRIHYLHELLTRHKIEIPENIKYTLNLDDINMDNFETINGLILSYTILSNEEYAKCLFESIKNNEYAKFKIKQIFDEFKSKRAINLRIEKTTIDVTRQLKRIYYLRNKIVHQGHHGKISTRIYSHLCEYVGFLLGEVITTLCATEEKIDLFQILQGYALALDSKAVEWDSKDVLTFHDIAFLDPII